VYHLYIRRSSAPPGGPVGGLPPLTLTNKGSWLDPVGVLSSFAVHYDNLVICMLYSFLQYTGRIIPFTCQGPTGFIVTVLSGID